MLLFEYEVWIFISKNIQLEKEFIFKLDKNKRLSIVIAWFMVNSVETGCGNR